MQKDAYTLLLEAIEAGVYKPGDRLVESELAERLGVSRTPVREALQRLETQAMLTRDGRSLIVASLDHNQLAELYTVRTELEGLAARLAARHATTEEVNILREMVAEEVARFDVDVPAVVIDGVEVSCIDIAMPLVMMRAADMGKTGYETAVELDKDRALMERMEAIRRKAGVLMGMGDVSKNVVPKIALLAHRSLLHFLS